MTSTKTIRPEELRVFFDRAAFDAECAGIIRTGTELYAVERGRIVYDALGKCVEMVLREHERA